MKFGDERLPSRFWAKASVGPGECWTFTRTDVNGYGYFKFERRHRRAHRVSYETLVGPVPDGLQLDHVCRNRACVNPVHLEPVTASENVRRGVGPELIRRKQLAKTRCPKGHPYAGANLLVYQGRRFCRECGLAAKRKYNHKIKEARQ